MYSVWSPVFRGVVYPWTMVRSRAKESQKIQLICSRQLRSIFMQRITRSHWSVNNAFMKQRYKTLRILKSILGLSDPN